jgi:hypothetical protein
MSDLAASRALAVPSGIRSLACIGCRHFSNEPLALEAAFSGLSALSSAFASVRSNDGLCNLHDRYVAGSAHCASFEPR